MGNGAARAHPRLYLFIGTKGGNALRGLDLRAFRHGPAAAFFKGAVMTLRVAESDKKYKRRVFFDGALRLTEEARADRKSAPPGTCYLPKDRIHSAAASITRS